jgi:hypothetical protein
MTVFPCRTFVFLTVYERKRREGERMPKYFVSDNTTNRTIKEFRRRDRAYKWTTEVERVLREIGFDEDQWYFLHNQKS